MGVQTRCWICTSQLVYWGHLKTAVLSFSLCLLYLYLCALELGSGYCGPRQTGQCS